MPFLTAVDTERINIRGSRDPLGVIPVWGHWGRRIVGNLTTASSSVRGFATLLLGAHLARRAAEGAANPEATYTAAFLKFEQIAAYVRVLVNKDRNLRGITEVQRHLAVDATRIPIGAARDRQILANQRMYGLWGLYTNPAVSSGLMVSKTYELTAPARDLVETEYLRQLRAAQLGDGDGLVALLRRNEYELRPDGRDAAMCRALGRILSTDIRPRERELYWSTLVLGGVDSTNGRQPRVVELLQKAKIPAGPFDHNTLQMLIRQARGTDAQLHDHLVQIRELELLLVAMDNLFGFLQARDGAHKNSVARELAKEWANGLRVNPASVEAMRSTLATVLGDDMAAAARLVALATALKTAKFGEAVDLVLAHNAFVMRSRHGADPWIRLEADRLDVRFVDTAEQALLPPGTLATRWQSGFYLNPLKALYDELGGATNG